MRQVDVQRGIRYEIHGSIFAISLRITFRCDKHLALSKIKRNENNFSFWKQLSLCIYLELTFLGTEQEDIGQDIQKIRLIL